METVLDRLQEMINKPYLYNGKEVVIINYCDSTGENGDEVEIYLNDGRTIEVNYAMLSAKLNQFQSITKSVIVLSDQRLDSVSSINPTIVGTMRDIILEQIKELKSDPSKVNQAKQVFQGVNTMINLTKTELEYRKFLHEMDKIR